MWGRGGALFALVVMALVVIGAGGPEPMNPDGAAKMPERLTIVATTSMIGDAIRNIAGPGASVTILMGYGVDPHGYRQTRRDIVRLREADLVFRHGLYLEAQMEGLFHELERHRPGRIITLGEHVPDNLLLRARDGTGQVDPHIWMDPAIWHHVVVAARDSLVAANPASRELYQANAARYLDDIASVGDYARLVLASISEEKRLLVTAHDAFAYLGRAYGLQVEGVQGISTASEAGLQRVEELVDLVVARQIPSVFAESSVSERAVQALVEGARARGFAVKLGGSLFSDATGRSGTYEGSYVGMIDHNVTVIAGGLGGHTPKGGMSFRLALR